MSEPLRVEYERSGGFAGLTTRAQADAGNLAPEEADALRAMVEQAAFFSLPAHVAPPARGADRFEHAVTVIDGERRHTVRVSEGAVPDTLRPLVDYLVARARRGAGSAEGRS